MNSFNEFGWKATIHPLLSEMFTVKTKGPNIVPYLEKAPRIVIDKIAAESVFVGSNLFGVGIKRVDKFSINDVVSITSPQDQIVAIGTAKIDSKTPKKPGIAVINSHSFYNVPSLRELGFIESGNASSQSIPAAYVAHVLDPQENDTIVDLCAAPGGKSTSAAILSNLKAKIVAFDRSKRRLQKMRRSIAYQNIHNIEVIHANSIEFLKTHSIRADKVIVDPSCSAVGVRPKILDNTQKEDIINSASYQKPFLWAAEKILKKGGTITYSTCTMQQEENEKVVSYAVNELNLKLEEPHILMGSKGEDTNDGLELEGMRRFYPDEHDTPGFFVAKLVKKD